MTNLSFYEKMAVALSATSLKRLHWKIWFLSAMGIFLEGFDLFVISVALPLIIQEFAPSDTIKGLIGSSAIIGMIFGASIGGRLTDKYGRRFIYLIDLFVFILFTLLTAISWNSLSLIIFRFFLGVGIGADYPICASYISELMPARIRGRMLISAFSFQAVGMIAAAIVGLFVLSIYPEIAAWRWILAVGAIPAIIVLILRSKIFESPLWQIANGKHELAIQSINQLTHIKTAKLREIEKNCPPYIPIGKVSFKILFTPLYIRSTILSAVPWFLMDIATYAVGIFTPILLASLIWNHPSNTIAAVFSSVSGSAFLDLFLIIGFLINIALVEKWGRINLQVLGLIGMTVGSLVLIMATMGAGNIHEHIATVFIGFMIFNVFMNMGPNATTFTIPVEVFPTAIRGTGHGFSSALAKVGAFLGIFFLPMVTHSFGLAYTLISLAFVTLLGAIFTIIFQIETKGRVLN